MAQKCSNKKGMFSLSRFPIIFFIYEVLGSKFCMSISITLNNWWFGGFFPKGSHFPGKRAKLDSFIFSEGEKQQTY